MGTQSPKVVLQADARAKESTARKAQGSQESRSKTVGRKELSTAKHLANQLAQIFHHLPGCCCSPY